VVFLITVKTFAPQTDEGAEVKVLMAMPFSPVPPDFGGALRLYHLLRQLAKRHNVTVLTYGTAEDGARIRQEFDLPHVRTVAPTWKAVSRRGGQLFSTFTRHSFFQQSVTGGVFAAELDSILNEQKFDVVQTEVSHLGPFTLKTAALKVLDAHNVEYDNFRRMYQRAPWGLKKLHYGLEYRKMKADELNWCGMQDIVLTTSDRDKALFSKDVRTPVFVVPNGVDTGYFTPTTAIEPEPHSLVFTGMMAYPPNNDGITWFLDEVLPLIEAQVPQVKLYVVGKNPPAAITRRASERIVVTGAVPDVRPFIWRSSVYVVPLRMGGGTRLKVAEALAMKKPIVSTRIGCEGIDVKDGESVLIADSPQPFADAVVRLLGDVRLCKALAENGHQMAKEKYDWNVIGETLEAIYQRNVRR
jgi:polysaccharide biosynthesis protein PslH